MNGTIIDSSSFGYDFISTDGTQVSVEMFKTAHALVNYEQWHPETDIFDEKERKLVEQITALAK